MYLGVRKDEASRAGTVPLLGGLLLRCLPRRGRAPWHPTAGGGWSALSLGALAQWFRAEVALNSERLPGVWTPGCPVQPATLPSPCPGSG